MVSERIMPQDSKVVTINNPEDLGVSDKKPRLSRARRLAAAHALTTLKPNVDYAEDVLIDSLTIQSSNPQRTLRERMADVRIIAQEEGNTIINMTPGPRRPTYRLAALEDAPKILEGLKRATKEREIEAERKSYRESGKHKPNPEVSMQDRAWNLISRATKENPLNPQEEIVKMYLEEGVEESTARKRAYDIVRNIRKKRPGQYATIIIDRKTYFYKEDEDGKKGQYISGPDGTPLYFVSNKDGQKHIVLPTITLIDRTAELLKHLDWENPVSIQELQEKQGAKSDGAIKAGLSKLRIGLSGTGIAIKAIKHGYHNLYILSEAEPNEGLLTEHELTLFEMMSSGKTQEEIISSFFPDGNNKKSQAKLNSIIYRLNAKLIRYFASFEQVRKKNKITYSLAGRQLRQGRDSVRRSGIENLVYTSREYIRWKKTGEEQVPQHLQNRLDAMRTDIKNNPEIYRYLQDADLREVTIENFARRTRNRNSFDSATKDTLNYAEGKIEEQSAITILSAIASAIELKSYRTEFDRNPLVYFENSQTPKVYMDLVKRLNKEQISHLLVGLFVKHIATLQERQHSDFLSRRDKILLHYIGIANTGGVTLMGIVRNLYNAFELPVPEQYAHPKGKNDMLLENRHTRNEKRANEKGKD